MASKTGQSGGRLSGQHKRTVPPTCGELANGLCSWSFVGLHTNESVRLFDSESFSAMHHKDSITVVVTGAAGQIAYSLFPRLRSSARTCSRRVRRLRDYDRHTHDVANK
jgi:hypothetical protein